MDIAMSIAGFDPTSGAGVLRDIITFRKIGVYGVGVVTAITYQSTRGVEGYFPIPAESVGREIDGIMEDMDIEYVKVGMIGNGKIANIVAEKMKEYKLKVIFDPVMRAKNSHPLIERREDIEPLLKISLIITPNIMEAEILSGVKIEEERDIIKAGRKIREKYGAVVIIKGGHYHGVDYLIDNDIHRLNMEYFEKEVHGTGCSYSSSLTAYLAMGYDILRAFRETRIFMENEIKNSLKIGGGWEVLP